MAKRHHSPRLTEFDYQGPLAGHLVFVTPRRQQFFSEAANAELAVVCLQESAVRLKAVLHAYCVMPDHVHTLVEVGTSASIVEFARRFKQLTGFRLKARMGTEIWQVSYYDHILRADEDLRDIARYIWNNPVEDGITAEYASYPFSGPPTNMTAWNR